MPLLGVTAEHTLWQERACDCLQGSFTMPKQLESPTSTLFAYNARYSSRPGPLRMSLAPSTSGKQPLQLQVALNECAFWDCASGDLSFNPGLSHC